MALPTIDSFGNNSKIYKNNAEMYEDLARKTQETKQRVEPTNIIKMLTGAGGSLFKSLRGMINGQSEKKAKKKNTYEALFVSTVTTSLKPIRIGDSVSDAVSKLYTLFKENFDAIRLKDEMRHNFDKENESEIERRHRDLLKALTLGRYAGGNATGLAAGSTSSGGWLDWLSGLLEWPILRNLLGWFSRAGGALWNFLRGPLWRALVEGVPALGRMLLGVLPEIGSMLLPLAAALAPMVAMGVVTWLVAPAENGGNTEGQTKFLNFILKSIGFKSQTAKNEDLKKNHGVAGEDLEESGIVDTLDVFGLTPHARERKQRIEKINKRIKDHDTFKIKEADAIKRAYNIDIPQNLVMDHPEWTHSEHPEDAPMNGIRPAATATPVPVASTGSSTTPAMSGATDGSTGGSSSPVASTATPAPDAPSTGAQLEGASKQSVEANLPAAAPVTPIVITGGTTNTQTGTTADGDGVGSPAVRNYDETLKRAQETSIRKF